MTKVDYSSADEMLPAERRQRLIEWFDEHFAGSSLDLAKLFNISISTIRRDLDQLSSEGLLRRTHGGAVRIRQHTAYEPSTDLARRTAVEEKGAIITEAVKLIEPDQSILIDTGAIAHDLADAVATLNFPLTVITNDLYVANKLTYITPINIVVPGGTNRPGAYSLVGEPGVHFLQSVRCDLYFMSAQAIDGECTSETSLPLVEVKRAMLDASDKTVLLADSSRFDSRALYRISNLDRVHTVITDEALPIEEREKIMSHGIKLICVEV